MSTRPSVVAAKAATARLISAHRAEYDIILGEERAARGLTPEPKGSRGRPAGQKRPAPPLVRVLRPGPMADALGITAGTWSRWLDLGIPAERADDVARAAGLPVEVLWPEVAA